MEPLHNIAITGITTIKELKEITLRIEGSNLMPLNSMPNFSKVFYTNERQLLNDWPAQDYTHCVVYTVKQFKRKFMRVKPKLSLRKIYQM